MFQIGFGQLGIVFQTAVDVAGHQIHAHMMIELNGQGDEFFKEIDFS